MDLTQQVLAALVKLVEQVVVAVAELVAVAVE